MTLLRARTHNKIIMGDLEKAFLQIGVNGEDRDLLRFLFYDDIDDPGRNIITYRFTKVPFGLVSSMTLLGNVVKKHLEKFQETDRELVEEINRSLYVDDLILGADSDSDILEKLKKAKEIFKEGGFNIKKLKSNSKFVTQNLGEGVKRGVKGRHF